MIVITFTEYDVVFFNILSENEMSTINKGYMRLQTRIYSTLFLFSNILLVSAIIVWHISIDPIRTYITTYFEIVGQNSQLVRKATDCGPYPIVEFWVLTILSFYTRHFLKRVYTVYMDGGVYSLVNLCVHSIALSSVRNSLTWFVEKLIESY